MQTKAEQKPIITMRAKALAQWLKEKGTPRPLKNKITGEN